MMAELKVRVNAMGVEQIDNVIISMQEEQLIKKLKDKGGIILAANVPGAEEDKTISYRGEGDVIMFIIEKIPAGSQTDDAEFTAYAKYQTIMLRLMKLLFGDEEGADNLICGANITAPEKLKIEWEYNIYGGYNGLSVSFKLTDNAGL